MTHGRTEWRRRGHWAALLLAGCGAVPCPGAVENVQVVATTATQAVLSYTAPDNSACAVAVSRDASYEALVPDVDGRLFHGAEVDNRSGSVATGRARLFVAGRRAAGRAADGKVYSRALQADTLHYFRITCGQDTAQGSFRTANIPLGNTWADPLPADPANPGAYLWPELSATDRGAAVVDPQTGALIRNLVLPGDMAGQSISSMDSAGIGFKCHETPVKASDSDKTGYHCMMLVGADSLPMLYWIAPSGGEVRNLGMLRTAPNAEHYGGYCRGFLTAPFSNADPNTFYCMQADQSGNKLVLVKGVYRGHEEPGADADLREVSPVAATPHTEWTDLTPITGASRDLYTLLEEFEPRYDAAAFPGMVYAGVQDDKLILYALSRYQDSAAWVFVFDPHRTPQQQTARFGSGAGCVAHAPAHAGKPGCIVATATTHAGAGANRWCGLHTLVNARTGSWVNVQANPLAGGGVGRGPYQVTIQDALPQKGTPCPARPAGSTIPDWPDADYAPGCNVIAVSGEPVSAAGPDPVLPAQAGDVVSMGTAFGRAEFLRILVKHSATSWLVQRGYGYEPHAARAAAARSQGTMMCGGLDPFGNATGGEFWWDFEGDPRGRSAAAAVNDPHFNNGHVSHAAGTHASYGVASGRAVPGFPPGRFALPATAGVNLELAPRFNGIAPLLPGVDSTAVAETHPSYSQVRAPEPEAHWMLDMRPYRGDYGTVKAENVTHVEGQLYKIAGLGQVTRNLRRMPVFAHSGTRPLRDVSSAATGDVIGTGAEDGYKYCIALRPNECRAGSSAGDIYFNAPGVVHRYCVNNRFRAPEPDICVGLMGAYYNAMVQTDLQQDDPAGQRSRVITRALGHYDGMTDFWNARALPDGSWAFTQMGPPEAQNVKLVKLPPFPDASGEDSAARRDRFVPVPVPVAAPAGTDNVVIEFGYAENGAPDAFYCTSRQQACVRGRQRGLEYSLAGEPAPGVPCDGGCTVTLPGIPERILYYRALFRNAAGRVVGASAPAAAAVRQAAGPVQRQARFRSE